MILLTRRTQLPATDSVALSYDARKRSRLRLTLASGREAGTLGEVVDGRAVAILRLDRIADPDAVTVDGRPVLVSLPGWATYRFGEAEGEE